MRKWTPAASAAPHADVVARAVAALGEAEFARTLLGAVQSVLPVASCSVYRVGAGCTPRLYLSAAHGVPDTTRECWRAYLGGPWRDDASLGFDAGSEPADACAPLQPALAGVPSETGTTGTAVSAALQVCHIAAAEVQPEHRARVYEAHGMAERVSVVQPLGPGGDGGALLAVNFYRHAHQRTLTDAQIAGFAALAPALLALARKQLVLVAPDAPLWPGAGTATRQAARAADHDVNQAAGVSVAPVLAMTAAMPAPGIAHPGALDAACARLLARAPALTAREQAVCTALLRGLSYDGVAAALGLAVPTVRTYRNRAFARLGIHFRSELFALALGRGED